MLIARGEAILSEDEKYRAWLTRDLGGAAAGPVLAVIGANPSTAVADKDDQTMRKEQSYARLWGCGLLVKVNMYAYRATDPEDLNVAGSRGEDVVGTIRGIHNDDYIIRALKMVRERGGIALAAWGKIPRRSRVAEVMIKIRDQVSGVELQCLGTNGDGSPKHTLYLKLDLKPQRWEPRVWAA